jgi:hypothetical protein
MFAGCGSARTFRDNFCCRLAEAFYNLNWLSGNSQQQFSKDEFEVYEHCYLQLRKVIQIPVQIQTILGAAYQTLKQRLVDANGTPTPRP